MVKNTFAVFLSVQVCSEFLVALQKYVELGHQMATVPFDDPMIVMISLL